MSKPSRRRQQTGSQPAAGRPAGARPPASSSSTGSTAANTPAPGSTRQGDPAARTASAPGGGVRAGRRERARITREPTFAERYRAAIVAVAAIAGVALIAIFAFASATATAYACTSEFNPQPTASPAAGATPALGYVQPDMGRHHVSTGEKVTYTYCPPASGSHDNAAGAGPIAPRLYGPNDTAIPDGWVHNLEHGAMVIVYRGRDGDPGITSDGQAALKALFDGFPPSPICGISSGTGRSPVIARFDEMATPYAAIVWDRVLPLQTLDTAKIVAFWQQWGEKTNPEPQCATPSASPSAAPSAAPSASPSSAPSEAPSSSAAPSAESSAPSPS